MTTVNDYRADLDALLATSVDAATWTTTLKDAALRLALHDYDARLVYETSLTVTVSGAQQDLAGIAGLDEVLALAYPWQEGADFAARTLCWRYVNDQTVLLEEVAPRAGQVIRVRHTRAHAIQALDGALATTVPERHRGLLGMDAAAWCCELRRRQVSENPAITEDAAQVLADLAEHFRDLFQQGLARAQTGGVLRWAGVGL
jgi:hypothetical protein